MSTRGNLTGGKTPKPDGGVRKLGIPTVIDRIIQQAIAQHLNPIYEPLFSEGSYGYRPNRSAQQAIQKVKEYAEQGYTQAVLVDLSQYFDTLNHDLLMNLMRKNVHDKRVIELVKRYLNGKALALHGVGRSASAVTWQYQARRTDCQSCPDRDRCLKESDKVLGMTP